MTNAVIGEPHAARGVEDDVVRSAQWIAIALGVEVSQLARRRVESLDATADVVLGRKRTGERETEEVDLGERPSVVADVQRTVRAIGDAIRSTWNLGERGRRSVGRDARDALAEHLDEHDRTVWSSNWTFGKLET